MARVLIVDADGAHNMTLGFALTARNHSVEVARSGSEGIDIGLHFRPEVIVVDWMLSGPLDGLQVSEALRAVFQDALTVLVTDFPSAALRAEAAAGRVRKFVDKSLGIDAIVRNIDETLEAESLPGALPERTLPLGLLHYDDDGCAHFANTRFKELFGRRRAGDLAKRDFLKTTFSHYSSIDLLCKKDEWMELKKREASSADFLGYVKRTNEGSRFLILLPKTDEELKEHSVLTTLLGLTVPPAISGRILVVDENNLQSRLAKGQIGGSGCRCHAADSMDVGLQMLRADPGIHTALLDYRTAKDVDRAVQGLKGIRPNLTIVGTCTAFRKPEFQAAGVDKFLVKPVIAKSLFELLGREVPTL